MVIEVTKAYYSSGTSFARGTTIDGYLTSEDCARLYELWPVQTGWPERLEFTGKVYAITAEMIREVPPEIFEGAFLRGIQGKADRKKALEVARRIYTKAGEVI